VIRIPEENILNALKNIFTEQLGETLRIIQAEQDDDSTPEDLRRINLPDDTLASDSLPSGRITIRKTETGEKERIMKQETHLAHLTISYGGRDLGRKAYRYAAAVAHILDIDPSLSGACRRAKLETKEYHLPDYPGDTGTASLRLQVRITTESL
jgi:hypothetical protein